jgi:hypothetical protein
LRKPRFSFEADAIFRRWRGIGFHALAAASTIALELRQISGPVGAAMPNLRAAFWRILACDARQLSRQGRHGTSRPLVLLYSICAADIWKPAIS